MDQQPDNKRTVISGIVAIAVLVLLVGGVMALKAKDTTGTANASKLTPDTASNTNSQTSSSSSNTSDSSHSSTSSSDSSGAGTYKDGTYTATGTYTTPESTEKLTVTVTLKDDAVADVSASGNPQAPETHEYQQQFLDSYKGLVVGKDIHAVSLSRVSGSSLTSRGFNDAIEQIKNQAHA